MGLTPKATMAPAAAAATAIAAAARKASASGMWWSEATQTAMAPGWACSIQLAAAAIAGAESRPSGSTIRKASAPISSNWRRTASMCASPVTTTGAMAPASPRIRSTVSWNSERAPSSGRNCLGRDGREAGHRRVPAPPQRITGMTVG